MNVLMALPGGVYDPAEHVGPLLVHDLPFLFDADSHAHCRGPWCPRADVLILEIPIADPGENWNI